MHSKQEVDKLGVNQNRLQPIFKDIVHPSLHLPSRWKQN